MQSWMIERTKHNSIQWAVCMCVCAAYYLMCVRVDFDMLENASIFIVIEKFRWKQMNCLTFKFNLKYKNNF